MALSHRYLHASEQKRSLGAPRGQCMDSSGRRISRKPVHCLIIAPACIAAILHIDEVSRLAPWSIRA